MNSLSQAEVHKMSILEKLYNGDVYPAQDIVCNTPEYRELFNKINEERQYFMKQLSPEDEDRFDEFENLLSESSSMYAYANFVYGFKLGTMLMCEVIKDNAKPDIPD